MFNCATKLHPTEEVKPKPNSKLTTQKPVLLSSKRYEKILTHATKNDLSRAQEEAAEDQKYRDYLKKGSDELVAQFTSNVKRTMDQELDDLKVQQELQQARMKLNESKENEEQVRREKIVKAQQLIEKLKPGPRELHTAAMHSEVLRARNVQRNINAEFEKAVKQHELEEQRNCEHQSMPFIQEEQQRLADHQQRNNKYKQELLQTIGENGRQRSDFKRQLLKEQQAARDAVDQEIKAQIEKEKAIMEKKRSALRKNALEAMKMVEQRRMRERMTEELDDRLCCVYEVGKRTLDTLKCNNSKQQILDRKQMVEQNAQQVAAMIPDVPRIEAERLQRDISRMQLKFTAEEQEKKRKDKAAKQARIEAYMREMEQLREVKRRADEQKRFDMAQRFKNAEVNCLFVEAEKQERERKAQELRDQFKKQMEERARDEQTAQVEEARVDCMQLKNDKDDKFFFAYAKNLMTDAQQKERSLYPFMKVVQQYKRQNNIECERKQPRHMVSQLTQGVRQAGDSKAAAAAHAAPPSSDKAQILENCLQIKEMLATAAAGVEKKPCVPAKCLQEKSLAKPRTAGGAAAANDAGGDGGGGDADVHGGADAISLSASAKVRYSMQELRKMNSFAAPSLH